MDEQGNVKLKLHDGLVKDLRGVIDVLEIAAQEGQRIVEHNVSDDEAFARTEEGRRALSWLLAVTTASRHLEEFLEVDADA